jgi:hypothetical protein
MTMLKQRAVERQVRKEREDLFRPLLNGIVIDGKQGSMERLAAEMDFERLINLHNSGDRPLDAHEPVCIGSQFENGVRFMVLTTPHLLDNMARAKNCGWQIQGHFDGSFKFCQKEFAMLGFGMNSLGAHCNSVCVAIVNGETAEAYQWTYRAVVDALYLKYRLLKPQHCKFEECLACSLQLEHDRGQFRILRNNMKEVAIKRFPLDKPSSDNSGAFIKFAKAEFGKEVAIQQCGVHFTGTASRNFYRNFSRDILVTLFCRGQPLRGRRKHIAPSSKAKRTMSNSPS